MREEIDITVEAIGGLYVITPITETAKHWMADQFGGNSAAIRDPKFLDTFLFAALDADLLTANTISGLH